jgi:Ca-activated chloride channel homolog
MKLKKVITVISIAFLLIAKVASATTISDYRNNKKGIKLYNKGQASEAIEKFSTLLQSGDESGKVNYNLANAYYMQKEYDNAVKEYVNAIDIFKDEGLKQKAYFNLGNTFFQQGQLEDAIKFYQQSLYINPEDKAAKHNLELTIERMRQAQSEPEEQEQEQDQKEPPPEQDQEELQKQLEEEQEKAEEERRQRENDINQILSQLDQREKEARQNHLKNDNISLEGVEKDW